ncbi:MAG: hypothetical protein AAB093_01920 [Nitrospirota bacterium]
MDCVSSGLACAGHDQDRFPVRFVSFAALLCDHALAGAASWGILAMQACNVSSCAPDAAAPTPSVGADGAPEETVPDMEDPLSPGEPLSEVAQAPVRSADAVSSNKTPDRPIFMGLSSFVMGASLCED